MMETLDDETEGTKFELNEDLEYDLQKRFAKLEVEELYSGSIENKTKDYIYLTLSITQDDEDYFDYNRYKEDLIKELYTLFEKHKLKLTYPSHITFDGEMELKLIRKLKND